MDSILDLFTATDQSTRCNWVRWRFILLVLDDSTIAWPKVVNDDAAWIGRRTRSWRCLADYAESVVCHALTWRKEQVGLRKEGCWIEFQSLVIAGWERSHLIIIWWLLSSSLIADCDDVNRIVILKEINFQFLIFALRFRSIYWVVKSFSSFIEAAIIVGTLSLATTQ